jgi:hypothetical protein
MVIYAHGREGWEKSLLNTKRRLIGCYPNPWSEHNKIKICIILLRPQHCNTAGLQHLRLSPKGEFWVCSETNFRMVRNSFQRAKWVLGNGPLIDNGNAQADESPLSSRGVRGAISQTPLLFLSRIISAVDSRSQHPSIVSPRGIEGCNRVVPEDSILCN